MHSEGLTSTGPAAWNFCLRQNARKWTFLKRKFKKNMGGAPNFTGFACKTGSWTVKNTTQNAPKLTILRAKIEKFSVEGTPPPTPHPLGAASSPICAVVNWPLKSAVTHSLSNRLELQTHLLCLWRARPVRRQTDGYVYLPSLRRYQIILLGWQRHTRVNNLPRVAHGSAAAWIWTAQHTDRGKSNTLTTRQPRHTWT